MKYLRYISFIFCLAVFPKTMAQEAALSGKVYDASTQKVIVGAAVSIPGVTSAFTNEDGTFQLKKTVPDASLQIKADGYATKIVPIRQQRVFEIYLYEEAYLNAVKLYDMPYGQSNSLSQSLAVSSIDASNFKKRGAVSAEDVLVGGSGLNAIARSGSVGSGSNFYIRGFNSLNANTQPLIVLDGMPINNTSFGSSIISGSTTTPMSYMEAKDIESITVLKDGTALYGSKGSNGVILITTLKPNDMATRINFYAYTGINMEPANQYRMLGSSDYRSYLAEMLQNSGKYSQDDMQQLPYLNPEKPYMKEWGWEGNVDYYRYNKESDWQDEVFRNSLNQNYYIDIKGGDEVAMFALSLGFLKHNGVVEGTDFSRYTARFNSRFNMGKRMTLFSNMGFTYGEKALKDEGLVSTNPLLVALTKAPFMTPYVYGADNLLSRTLEEADVFGVSNPYAAVHNTDIRSKKYRFEANLKPQFSLTKDLSVNALFGLTTDKTSERTFYPMAGMSYDDHRLGEVNNKMGRRSLRFFQIYTDVYFKYNKKIAYDHQFLAAAGVRYQSNDIEEDWTYGYNSPTDDMKSVGSGDADFEQTGGVLDNWKWLSYYLHADYAFKNRYFLTFSSSLDGSSNYGKEAPGCLKMFNTPFASFSSVAASWLLSSENFMQGVDWLDQLKIRASIGTSGNDNLGTSYTVLKYYESASYLGQYGTVRGNIPNTKLQWETAVKRNVGLDVSLLNERLNLNVDVYDNATNHLLCAKTMPSRTGITRYLTNDGSLSNRGFEVGVQARLVNQAFKWDLGVQVSNYKNELTQYADNRSITEYAGGYILTQVGQPLGLFYGYQTDGVYSTQEQANADGLSTVKSNGQIEAFSVGDVRFVNNDDSDRLINEKDRVVIGDPNPDFFGSISSLMQWKRFKLNALFSYSLGNDVYNALRCQMESMTGTSNQTQAVMNRWCYEGQQTDMPKAVWGDPLGNARFSDRWIEDGSYLKLKTLTLSYQVPLNGNLSILRGLEVYATGNNLFVLTNYLGYDPEFNASQNPLYYGIDTGMSPLSASLLFGVKIAL